MTVPMRLALATALVLFATTTALAQPGATGPDQPYGPPQAPTYGAPPPQAPPQAPIYGAPPPQAPPQAPIYGAPPPQAPTYGAPPAPQPYPPAPQTYPQPYPPQAPTYGAPSPQPYAPQPYPQRQQPPYPQPYAPQPYAPRPYTAPYAQAPVGGLTQPVVREIKRPGTAQALAVGVTGLGLVAIFAGADDNNEELALAGVGMTLIGPSAGHIYAGENGHALKMTLLRTGGLLTFIWGAVKQDSSYDCIDYCYEDTSDNEGETAMYVGGAVFVLGTLYDIYDSGRAARRYNERAARALTVGPTMMSAANGGTSPGVALSGRF